MGTLKEDELLIDRNEIAIVNKSREPHCVV